MGDKERKMVTKDGDEKVIDMRSQTSLETSQGERGGVATLSMLPLDLPMMCGKWCTCTLKYTQALV